jgi:hypothetical protein
MLCRKPTRCAVKVAFASIGGCFFSGPHRGQSLMQVRSPASVMLRCARSIADGRAWPGLRPYHRLWTEGRVLRGPWFEPCGDGASSQTTLPEHGSSNEIRNVDRDGMMDVGIRTCT